MFLEIKMKEYAKRIVTGTMIFLSLGIAATDHYVTKLKQQQPYEDSKKQALWREFEARCEYDTSNHIRNLNDIVEDRGFSIEGWYCNQDNGRNIARRM
jgi:hypothetical protein